MKDVIKILEKQYQSFINQERDWNFFLGLADYVDLISKEPEFNSVLKKMKRAKEKEIKAIEGLDRKAISELQTIKLKILRFFKNKNLPKDVATKLKELANYKIDNINIFPHKYSGLESKLKDTIRFLWMHGYKNLAQEILVSAYNTIWKEPKKEIPEEDIMRGFYELSKSALSMITKGYEFNEKKDIEL